MSALAVTLASLPQSCEVCCGDRWVLVVALGLIMPCPHCQGWPLIDGGAR